ncbi:MAG: hypothetical protein JOZ78_17445 [Chroococcidiopsidaceae cyanobacterium CP_BM_ER_R8_30]|nr:hypothetical protein [Chroococcidiopsidaceae cyanobacterium CP_BM_ER_R8_30]
MKKVQNFDVGGTVGGGSASPAYRAGQRVASSSNVTVIQNISTPDANSFRKSASQLHTDTAYQTRRAYEWNH